MNIHSKSEAETLQIGARLGAVLREGDVVLLHGEMGAGKSVFCRGVARGMGVLGPVPSPTFTLLNIHDGQYKKLYHFDLYRLDDVDELYQMGLEEYIGTKGVTLIEWPGRAPEAMPSCHLEVTLRYTGADGEQREIEVRPRGGFECSEIEAAIRGAVK